MMIYFRLAIALSFTISLLNCAPSRIVRPLKTNEQIIGLSIGGPLINYNNSTIPMPLTTIQYARGLTNKTTMYGSLHTTSLLYGIIQTDIGACRMLYHNDKLRLGVTANPALNLAFDKWEKHTKAWPQLDVNAYWEIKPGKSFFYLGVSNWFELSKYRAHGESQTQHWLCNPQIGFNYTRQRWSFVLEGKYLAPTIKTTPNVVEYKGIAGNGAIGVYVSINRKLK